MPIEYIESKELFNALTDVMSDQKFVELEPIRAHEVKIMPWLKVQQDKNNEDVPPKGDPVTLKKVTPLEKKYIEADYLLIMDNYTWNTCSKQQQHALVHRGLARIKVVEKEDGVRLATQRPDIVESSTTLLHFGPYDDRLLNLREVYELSGKALVKRLGPPTGEA